MGKYKSQRDETFPLARVVTTWNMGRCQSNLLALPEVDRNEPNASFPAYLDDSEPLQLLPQDFAGGLGWLMVFVALEQVEGVASRL